MIERKRWGERGGGGGRRANEGRAGRLSDKIMKNGGRQT